MLFSRRTAEAALKNLFALNLDISGITETSTMFIKPSLSSYSKIDKVFTEDDGVVKIKFLWGDFSKIKHESDLIKGVPAQ